MRRTLYLLRHAATEPETPWRFTGRRHRPLSALGLAQAARWRRRLADAAFAGAWRSPLPRAAHTARLVLEGRALQAAALPDLAEIDLGEWEGLSVDDVRARHPGQYEARGRDLAGYRPPGGESFADLARRAACAVDKALLEAEALPEGPLLFVTHAGWIRALACRLLDIPLARVLHLQVDQGALCVVEAGDGPARLVRWNVSADA